jgi:hypothetical protein
MISEIDLLRADIPRLEQKLRPVRLTFSAGTISIIVA